jgi:predicted dienelactone hydrolase
VLLLSPSGFPPLLLGTLAEELASHGHVVVGVNHTYDPIVTVFDDGRTIPANPAASAGALGPQSGSHEEVFRARAEVCMLKAADLSFVADRVAALDGDADGPFGGRLDLERVGALGHSFGGNAALEWCRADPRGRAAVNLDGALWTDVARHGLDRPALQVLADHHEFDMAPGDAVKVGMAPSEDWFVAERETTFGGWRAMHERAQPGHTVRISGATHLSFLDVPFLPTTGEGPVVAMLSATTIEPSRMWRLCSDVVLAFFATYLDGAAPAVFDAPDPTRPELAFEPT